jgi:hypothetical protein
MSSASVYELDLQVTGDIDDSTADAYIVVAGVTSDNDNRNNLSIAYSTSSIDNSTRNFVCDNTDSCLENTSVLDYAISVDKQDSGPVWDVQYDDLQDGTYYFHVKAKDNAGNWGDSSHYRVMIDTAGVRVDIISPFNSQVFSTGNITATVEVNEDANVSVVAMHPDGSNFTSASAVFTGEHEFNITLENGTNRLYAVAVNPANGVVTYSPDVYVTLGVVAAAARTLRVVYSGSSCSGHLCSVDEGLAYVGIATENDTASFGANDLASDTGFYTIKIFATTPSMPVSSVESDLDDDDFLDRTVPMFGYEHDAKGFVIRTEVRYPTAYLAGERTVGPGKYSLVFRNLGTTPEGKANVSVRII